LKNITNRLGKACIWGLVLLIIDFITKWLANALLPYQESVATPLPFLLLYLTHNKGYHWIFGNIENQFLWAIVGLLIVSIMIFSLIRTIRRTPDPELNLLVILSLIIGAAGNVLEVLFFGRATDFFIFRPFPWPSNLCDQYINAVIYIMLPISLIKAFLDKRKEKSLTPDQNDKRQSQSQQAQE
jgi:lipoprotein signal peptidase